MNILQKLIKKELNNEKIVLIMSLFVFIICAWHIPQRTMIFSSTLEFSQFSIAAFLAGYDWSSVTANIPYAQFGYPLIFLLPLFWIFGDNILAIYRAALVINAIFAALIVPVSYYILKQWGIKDLKENKLFIPVILFTSLAGCIIAYSGLALSEVLLILLCLLLTALLLRMQNKGANYKTIILFAFLLVFGFSVHLRFIGILFSGILVVVTMEIMKKIKHRYFISFILTILLLLTGIFLLKRYFQINLWNYSNAIIITSNNRKDIYVNIGKIVQLFTTPGLFSFFKIFFGQLWYIGISSFLLVFAGLYGIIKDNVVKIRAITKKESEVDLSIVDIDYSTIFIILGFITTFFTSVLFHINTNHAEQYLFGRYNDLIFIPIMLYALMNIVFKKIDINIKAIFFLAGFLILSVAIYILFNIFSLIPQSMSYFNIVNLNLFKDFIFISILAILGILLLIITVKNNKFKGFLAIILLMTIFNISSGYTFINKEIIPYTNRVINFKDLSDIKYQNEIYLFGNQMSRQFHSSFIQLAMPESKLNFVGLDNISSISDSNNFVIMHRNDFRRNLQSFGVNNIINYNQEKNIVYFKLINSDNTNIKLPVSIFNTRNGEINGNKIISNGQAGYLLYGPYFYINKDRYAFISEIELINSNAPDSIGKIDIYSNRNKVIYASIEIQKSDFVNDKLSIPIVNNFRNAVSDIEYRIYVNENVIISVSNVYYRVANPIDIAIWNEINLPEYSINVMNTENGVRQGDSLVSSINAGILMASPKSLIIPGSYIFSVECELLNFNEAPNAIGWGDVVRNNSRNNIEIVEIRKRNFINGKFTLEIPVTLTTQRPDVEFRILTLNNVILKVSNPSVRFYEEEEEIIVVDVPETVSEVIELDEIRINE